MLANKDLLEDIRLGFALLQEYVRSGGRLNLTDINVHAEDFVGSVLNALYSWNLENMNTATSNFPCIDLIDRKERIGIQVTSERGARKLNNTLTCARRNGLASAINQLKVFSLVRKQETYKVTETCPGVSFNWRVDVLDFDALLQQINAASDLQRLKAVHSVVCDAFPILFASRLETLRAMRDRIEKDIVVFDREVMRAPARFEDPVLMYQALREMRTELQKNGSSTIANSVAARNFKAAHTILREAEYEIRGKYPYIHAAADSGTPVGKYPNGEFDASISLMMGIRGRLQSLLDEVKRELASIDLRLQKGGLN